MGADAAALVDRYCCVCGLTVIVDTGALLSLSSPGMLPSKPPIAGLMFLVAQAIGRPSTGSGQGLSGSLLNTVGHAHCGRSRSSGAQQSSLMETRQDGRDAGSAPCWCRPSAMGSHTGWSAAARPLPCQARPPAAQPKDRHRTAHRGLPGCHSVAGSGWSGMFLCWCRQPL